MKYAFTGLLLSLCCLFYSPSFGQSYSYVAGSSSNIFPFSTTASNMVQWLMLPSFFPTAPAGNITTIYLKPYTSTSNVTYTNLTVKMGTTALTAMATGPWVSGLTTVYTAPTTTFATVTAGGWVQITLQTPFYYSGTSNFVLEISQTAYSGSGFNLTQDISTGQMRLYGNVAATTGTQATGTVNFGFDLAPAICSGTPATPAITTPAITNPICNATTTINASLANATQGGLVLQWEQAPSATGPWTNAVGGTGANTLAFTTPVITAAIWYRLKATCNNSALSSMSAAFAVPVAMPQPGAIAGANTFCPGATQVYSVPAASIPATYSWTLPNGWSGSSTTNSIAATTAGTAGGNVSVTQTGSCGTSIPRTLAVSLGSVPLAPAAITGNTLVCAGATQTYSVPSVPGILSYNWVLPSGWSGTSTTNTISATPGANGGNITVTAVNVCGVGAPQTLAVATTVQPLATGPIVGAATVCPNDSKWYNVAKVAGALSYTWTVPSGWSGTSTIDSINVTNIPATGTITVTANNGCAGAVPATKLITVLPVTTPSVVVSTASINICSGVPTTFVATPVNGGASPAYQWIKNGAIVGTSATYTDAALVNNDLLAVLMTSNYLCSTSATAGSNGLRMLVTQSVAPGVNVNTNSPGVVCSGDAVVFTANSFGGGTAPDYQWRKNNLPVGTNTPTFTLTSPASGDSVYCVLTSNAACATQLTTSSNKIGLQVTPTVVPRVTVTASPGTNIFNGQMVTFTANPVNGGSSPTYQWVKNGVNISAATSATYATNTLRNGDQISVRIISSNPCASPNTTTSGLVTISAPTSVGNVTPSTNNITLTPNPNNGHFVINTDWDASLNGKALQVQVLNTLGQIVYTNNTTITIGKWRLDVSLSDVAAGLYLLRLKADGVQMTHRFEVRK